MLIENRDDILSLDVDSSAEKLLSILERTDAFRRVERFEWFLSACQLLLTIPETSIQLLKRAYNTALGVDVQLFIQQGFEGAELGKKLKEARLKALGST